MAKWKKFSANSRPPHRGYLYDDRALIKDWRGHSDPAGHGVGDGGADLAGKGFSLIREVLRPIRQDVKRGMSCRRLEKLLGIWPESD